MKRTLFPHNFPAVCLAVVLKARSDPPQFLSVAPELWFGNGSWPHQSLSVLLAPRVGQCRQKHSCALGWWFGTWVLCLVLWVGFCLSHQVPRGSYNYSSCFLCSLFCFPSSLSVSLGGSFLNAVFLEAPRYLLGVHRLFVA